MAQQWLYQLSLLGNLDVYLICGLGGNVCRPVPYGRVSVIRELHARMEALTSRDHKETSLAHRWVGDGTLKCPGSNDFDF